MNNEAPEIPESEYNKKVGSDLPPKKPLPLLPEREWLRANIVNVKYQYAMFNNAIQYITYKDEETQEDVFVTDPDTGEKIPRKEFEIVFELADYMLPNNEPRKAWLKMGASSGEKAHLPKFLNALLGTTQNADTPQLIIDGLKGLDVLLQVGNKENKKDPDHPYQNVIWDAVKLANAAPKDPATAPISEGDVPF